MHPVWLEYLVIYIDQCIDDMSSSLKQVNALKTVDESTTSSLSPYQVFVEGSTVVAFAHCLKSVVYDNLDTFSDLKDDSETLYVNKDFDVFSLPLKVADDPMYRSCSGKMRNQYKMFMHNAERFMQVNMIGASGFYVRDNDDRKFVCKQRKGVSFPASSFGFCGA